MAILLEGYSLVFEIEKIEQKYPGGLRGLVYEWNNGSWCSDGYIGRFSYYTKDDAICCLLALSDRGLELEVTHAEDVALVLHGGHPWVPCLWLDIDMTPSGFMFCKHIEDPAEGGKIASPKYFSQDLSLAHYASKDECVLETDVQLVSRSGTAATFRDTKLDRVFQGPGFLPRH